MRGSKVILVLLAVCATLGLAIILAYVGLQGRGVKVESDAVGQVLKPDKVALEKLGFEEVIKDKVFVNTEIGDARFYPQKTSEKENFEEYQRLLADWEAKRKEKGYQTEYWIDKPFASPDYSIVIRRYKP